MMIKPREIFSELEDLSESGDHPLVINDFNHLMRQQAVWQGQHPQLMRLLCEISEEVSVGELEVGE